VPTTEHVLKGCGEVLRRFEMVSVDCPDGSKPGTLDCGHGAGNPFTKALTAYMQSFGFSHHACSYNGCHYTHSVADLVIAMYYHQLKAISYQNSIVYDDNKCTGDVQVDVKKYGLHERTRPAVPSPLKLPAKAHWWWM
jgi:hypothetical protein